MLGLLLCTNLSGCWDATDIEKLSFPYAMAYDLNKQTRKTSGRGSWVDVTVLTPNLSPRGEKKYNVEMVSVPLGAGILSERAFTSPDITYPALNQVLVVGEDLAKIGLSNYIDSFLRIPAMAVTMNMAVAVGRAGDLLAAGSKDYETKGVELRNLLMKSEKKGMVPSTTVHQFSVNLVTGKNPIMPIIFNTQERRTQFAGTAVFDKDKMIYKLNNDQTRYLMLLRGIKSKADFPFVLPVEDDGADQGMVRLKNSRKVKVTRNGNHYRFLILVNLKGEVVEHVPSGRLIDEDMLHKIESRVSQDVQRECEDMIRLMQEEIGVDCLDINKYALAKWQNDIKNIIDQPEFIRQAAISCKVKVKIYNTGELK